jgi:hypothetical protein
MNAKFEETKKLYGVDPVTLVNMPYWKTLEVMKNSITEEMTVLADEMKSISFDPGNYEIHAGLSREFNKKKKALLLVEQKREEIKGVTTYDYA